VEDFVLCMLRDNPTPVELPVHAYGDSPAVAVRLVGDAEPDAASDEAKAAKAEEDVRKAKEGAAKKLAKKGEVEARSGPANKILDEGIVFSRLTQGKKDQKALTLTNTSRLPLTWHLEGVEQLPEELRVSASKGELAAYEGCTVTVDFASGQPRLLEHVLELFVQVRGWECRSWREVVERTLTHHEPHAG